MPGTEAVPFDLTPKKPDKSAGCIVDYYHALTTILNDGWWFAYFKHVVPVSQPATSADHILFSRAVYTDDTCLFIDHVEFGKLPTATTQERELAALFQRIVTQANYHEQR